MSDIKKFPNLKPAQPGEVRNPNGRPKGSKNAKTIINKFLYSKEKIKHPVTGKDVSLTQLEIITMTMVREARNGNVAAFSALLDRTEGKPEQKNINSFDEGTEINVKVGPPKNLQLPAPEPDAAD